VVIIGWHVARSQPRGKQPRLHLASALVGAVPVRGKVLDAGLCYDPCRAGYHGVGAVCSQNCPAGYHDDGATCRRDALIIAADNHTCPLFDKCGLTFAKGCSSCPAGMGFHNDGCTCRRDVSIIGKGSYVRGAGELPVLDHGSGILTRPRIHTVFWNADAAKAHGQQLAQFSAFLANDNVYRTQLGRYMRGAAFSPLSGSVATAQGNSSPGGVNLTEAGDVISQAISAGFVPSPGQFDELYVLYLPPYKKINCESCDALHSSWSWSGFGGPRIGYYMLVTTSMTGSGTPDSLDEITLRTSHEYIEAVTDPICGGWYGGECLTYGEIADRCDFLGASPCSRLDASTRTVFQVEPVFSRPCGGCACN